MGYLDDRSVPRPKLANTDATLGKRDQMYFGNSDTTVAATFQMICGALSWPCAASVIRHDAG